MAGIVSKGSSKYKIFTVLLEMLGHAILPASPKMYIPFHVVVRMQWLILIPDE